MPWVDGGVIGRWCEVEARDVICGGGEKGVAL